MTVDFAILSPGTQRVDSVLHIESADDAPPGAVLLGTFDGFPACPAGCEVRVVDGALAIVDPRSLDELKAAKNAEINAARLAANRAGFMFAGKLISTDELSRSDIDGTNGFVALTGAFPDGWPGVWKADDNSYVPITDLATWQAFYSAMVAQGAANFATSQALKAQLSDAETRAEVEAIVWPTAP